MSDKKPFLLDAVKIRTTNVNTSTENRGRGDDAKKVLLKSVDMEAEISADVLEQLSASDKINYQKSFFRNDGTPKDLGIGKLPYVNEYNDQIIELAGDVDFNIQPITFNTKKIHKFSAVFSPGNQVKLHLQMQIYPTDAKENWYLEQMLLYNHYLKILPPPQLDFVNESEEAA